MALSWVSTKWGAAHSRVSGGWNYGHWDLSLSNDLSRYFVEEKGTGGGHETELYYTVDRTSYELANRDGNCGGGHTLSNRITKNTYADSWSTLCQIDTDLLMRWRPFPIQNYVSTVDSAELGIAKEDKVNTVTLGKFTPPGSISSNAGFVANMISLGSRGWLATAVGPLDLFEGTTTDEERNLRRPYQQIGFRRMPLTIESFVKNVSDYSWHWLDLDQVCAPTKGGDPHVGMVQLHNWGPGGEDSGRILLGYSPATVHPGRTNEYHVVQVDENGTFLHDPMVLERGGWGWDSLGTTLPESGCVVFPHSWLSDDSTTGPNDQYPRDDKDVTERSMYLKLTAVCPSGTLPPTSGGTCTTYQSEASLSTTETPDSAATCATPY